MTEPRSSPSNPDPMELERRDVESGVASTGAGALPAAGGATVYGSEAARADTYAATERADTGLNAGGTMDSRPVEPEAVRPGGLPTAAIVTTIIVIVLLLLLLFWLF